MQVRLRPSTFLVVFAGLCFGALGGMVASRASRHETLTSRSHCSHCGTELGIMDLLPVLSFVLLGGKCRYCKAKISPAYPIMELATMLWFCYTLGGMVDSDIVHFGMNHISMALGSTYDDSVYQVSMQAGSSGQLGLPFAAVLNAAIGFLVIVIAGSDGLNRVIPNSLLISLLPPILLGKTLSGKSALINALLGGMLGFTFLLVPAIIRPDALGGGDVKMAGAIGLYLGANKVFCGLGLSFILASLYVLPLLMLGIKKKTDYLPMGVFLSAGTLTWIVISRWLFSQW